MAGQSQHLFGSDWRTWLKTGLSQLTDTWEVLLQSVCHPLYSVLAKISTAQNVELHPCSLDSWRRKVLEVPAINSVVFVISFAQDLLYCGWHTRWLSLCLYPPLMLSLFCSAPWNMQFLFCAAVVGRFQPSLSTSDPPERQTNKLQRL